MCIYNVIHILCTYIYKYIYTFDKVQRLQKNKANVSVVAFNFPTLFLIM